MADIVSFQPRGWGRGRTLGLVAWLFIPLIGAAYHYGPGQRQLEYDDAGDAIVQVQRAVAAQDWAAVVTTCDDALAALPKEEVNAARRLRLERAKAQMQTAKLPLAHADLKGLLDEQVADPKADAALLRETRGAMANAAYYMTWLMRLEGVSREEWEPEIEQARQHYALLEATAPAGAAKTAAREDLAAAIRLARMDLSELQGLPLPSQ